MAQTIQVLVIDDDRLIRVLLRSILENEGLQVLDASGGRLGLKILRAAPCDLVITDLLMPDLDGVGVIREVRKEFPDVKIIALSGGGMTITAGTALDVAQKSGALRSLVKPVMRQQLLMAIQELFPEWQPSEAI
ncbi:MAG: response regulator [Magnetococcales bacterium]|nr:response regulator [Magnetococcales bacterium]MBF0438109.1 response regulator [Magnetococcales bacterium]